MKLRTHLRTLLAMGFSIAIGTVPTPASAQEQPRFSAAPFTPPARAARPIFDVAPLTAAAQATTTTGTNEHQLGVGVRMGGVALGIGGSVRYFFYGGPLGVQAEISRFGLDLGNRDWSSVQFSPAVIYRFVERKFDAPVSLTPYAGGGLSFIHSNFADEDVDFFEDLAVDDTDVGVLIFGGVELFFANIPKLGVSAELTFNSNNDIEATSVGGVAITGAAHWYFW